MSAKKTRSKLSRAKTTQKSASKASKVFTDEERAAMREYVQERKAEKAGKGNEESTVLAKIAAKDGKVLCFFQDAQKFKTRYATFGFSDKANLDEGNMWPVAFALKEVTAADEARIVALVKKAVS